MKSFSKEIEEVFGAPKKEIDIDIENITKAIIDYNKCANDLINILVKKIIVKS